MHENRAGEIMKKLQIVIYILALGVISPFFISQASAQSDFTSSHRDFFQLLFPNKSELGVDYTFQPGNDFESGQGEYDLQMLNVEAELPFPVSRDLYFVFGGDYEGRQYEFSNLPVLGFNDEKVNLHKLLGKAGLGFFATDDLLLYSEATIGAYSDFEDLNEDAVKVYGRGYAAYRINPGTQFIAGAAYSEDFDSTDWYPLAGFRIISESGKIHLSLTAPVEAQMTYQMTPQLAMYVGGWISGDTYQVKFGEVDSDFKMHIQDKRIGTGLLFWFTNHMNINAEVGYTLDSETNLKFDAVEDFEKDVEATWYVNAGLGFAL